MSSAVPVAAGSDPLSQPTTSPSASAEPERRASPQAGSEEREIEVDERSETDSAFADGDNFSDTTSLASSLLAGHIENGRKYATLRDDYWGPSDDQQFETMDAGHLVYLLLECNRTNPLFRAPIEHPQHILDIGTGPGTWAIDVADKFPAALVYGVDLFPPPTVWVPPNCNLQVEDVLQGWTWRHQFDLVHMRLMLGAFTNSEWDEIYGKCFNHIKSGGWIEQTELDVRVMSDDGSLPKDSLLAEWGNNFLGCAERAGRSLATQTTMKAKIEAAGFVDVQEQLYKCPIGRWPKNKVLKEAGRINFDHWDSGLEGWAMWLLTKFGAPEPWNADEVRVYVAQVRQELQNPKLHIWHYTRRVWGRRP